jgi:flagellar biosynthesis/type III secretory pathway chaperone
MRETWEKLITVLHDMLELYQAILELSKRKRTVLISGKAKDLELITKQEESLILQVGQIEKMRKNIMGEIIAGNSLMTGGLTLSQIKELADEDVAEQLDQLGSSLKNTALEIASVSDLNVQLIKQAMTLVNYNINILAQNVASPTYAPQGQSNNATKARVFIDQKV